MRSGELLALDRAFGDFVSDGDLMGATRARAQAAIRRASLRSDSAAQASAVDTSLPDQPQAGAAAAKARTVCMLESTEAPEKRFATSPTRVRSALDTSNVEYLAWRKEVMEVAAKDYESLNKKHVVPVSVSRCPCEERSYVIAMPFMQIELSQRPENEDANRERHERLRLQAEVEAAIEKGELDPSRVFVYSGQQLQYTQAQKLEMWAKVTADRNHFYAYGPYMTAAATSLLADATDFKHLQQARDLAETGSKLGRPEFRYPAHREYHVVHDPDLLSSSRKFGRTTCRAGVTAA